MNLLLNYCSEISSSAIEDSNFLSNQGTSYTIKEHLIPLLFFPSCTQRSRFGTDFILSRARSFHAAFKSSLPAATCLPLPLSKPFLLQYFLGAIAASFCFVFARSEHFSGMSEALHDLFGSIQDAPSADSLPPQTPRRPSAISGELSGGGDTITFSQPASTTHLLYLAQEDFHKRCLGLIGKSKVCVATNCKVAKHETYKFQPTPGLYIRVPRKMDQCFCTPTLPDSAFEADLSSFFLSVEKSVEDWNKIFFHIQSMEMQVKLEVWKGQNQII